MYYTDYRDAGFLAYVDSSMQARGGQKPVIFSKVEYNNQKNYNPVTGVYSVPLDGLYLIHVRIYGEDNDATHFIRVNGEEVAITEDYNPNNKLQSSSTSIVLHLKKGDQLTADVNFQRTLSGSPDSMLSSFGVNLFSLD